MSLLVTSLDAVSDRYDLIYCDIWGVLHNGLHKHSGADDALARFRQRGGQVALVTNAPRPHGDVRRMLAGLDISQSAYDVIVTSGDVTQRLMRAYAGEVVHHVGPDYDLNLFEGTGVIRGPVDEAKALVVSDLDEKGEELSDYDDRLADWLARGLPMICANPDKVVEVGDRLVYCGGALADVYEQMGGKVIMAGKPFAPIYETARDLLIEAGGAPVAPARALAIGDAARTDAAGAAREGVDFLFVTKSIHADALHRHGRNADDDAVNAVLGDFAPCLMGHMPRLV